MRFGKRLSLMAVLALAAASGCGDEETAPSGHTSPVAVRLVVNATQIQQGETLTLTAGQTAQVEVQLLDEHGDVITGIEDHHYVKLNFLPAELATSADVADHHFQKTVTAQASAGTGTLDIGYGHDVDADEKLFGTFTVEVVLPPCACGRGSSPDRNAHDVAHTLFLLHERA